MAYAKIYHFFYLEITLLSHIFENYEQNYFHLSHMPIRENMKKHLKPWKYGK